MSDPVPGAFQLPKSPGHKRPPGPRGHVLFGSAPDIQRNPTQVYLALARHYGDIVRIRFVLWPTYMVFHPDDVKHVLQDNHQNYNKDVYTYHALKPFVGEGLITNNGQPWLRQRRLIQPVFHRKHLATFGTLMSDATVAMLKQWESYIQQDQPLDIAAEMMRLTLQIVGQVLFQVDLSDQAAQAGQAFTTLNKLLSDYIHAPFPPLSVPTPRNRRLQGARHALDAVVDGIITEHRLQNADTGDLLARLLLARDEETGEGMSDRQVRDEVMTLLFAGHETTANALSWTWYLLSQHPDVEQRLRTELDEVLGGHQPTMDDLPNLPYTRMVLEEAMRLYPPAWSFGRKAIASDKIGGYAVPANTWVWLSPFVTHRHPAFWENPKVFDPERFTPEKVAVRPRYAYFPFGGGPRMCIGSHFAMMEAQLILATVAQSYRLRLVPGHPVEPEALLSLRPRYGLPMTIQAVN